VAVTLPSTSQEGCASKLRVKAHCDDRNRGLVERRKGIGWFRGEGELVGATRKVPRKFPRGFCYVLVLQAPHSVQWMKTPCTCPSLTCINKIPQFPQRKSIVSELVSGTGGLARGRLNFGFFTNLNFR
jgi:hypothetical protein